MPRRSVLIVLALGLSVVLSACVPGISVAFTNQCSESVDVAVESEDLLFAVPDWTLIAVGDTSDEFTMAAHGESFDVTVRLADTQGIVSQTHVTFAESLLWEPSGFEEGRWIIRLSGEDCSPVLPQEVLEIESSYEGWTRFLFGFTPSPLVLVVAVLVLLSLIGWINHRFAHRPKRRPKDHT